MILAHNCTEKLFFAMWTGDFSGFFFIVLYLYWFFVDLTPSGPRWFRGSEWQLSQGPASQVVKVQLLAGVEMVGKKLCPEYKVGPYHY